MAQSTTATEAPESIGSAKMLPNKTIVLRLRGETNGNVAEGYFEIQPSDSRYLDILKHIGGLEPGQEKPVPPWPSDSGNSEKK